MRRPRFRRDQILAYVLLFLIAVGILSDVKSLLLPIIIVGIVVLLYFFPPYRWKYWFMGWKQNRMHRQSHMSHRRGGGPSSDKTKPHVKLRVIKGNKPDQPEEPPRFH